MSSASASDTVRFFHPASAQRLTLRLALAGFGVVVYVLGALAFVVVVDAPLPAEVLALLAAVVLADLVVVAPRKRHGEPG